MSDVNWVTTKVFDQDGKDVTDGAGNMYVGYAYYHTDGNFRIVALDDAHKMYGKWSVQTNNGVMQRTLQIYNSSNEIVNTRTVDITELNNRKFDIVSQSV